MVKPFSVLWFGVFDRADADHSARVRASHNIGRELTGAILTPRSAVTNETGSGMHACRLPLDPRSHAWGAAMTAEHGGLS